MSNNTFTDLDNARVDEQRATMEQSEQAGKCPFCAEEVKKYHHLPILHSGKFWLVTPNQWPYDHTRYHLLFIHHTHIEHLREVSAEAMAELGDLATMCCNKYEIPGGGLVMRFGDTQYSAGSVRHLHAHLIVPEVLSKDFDPVRVKLGKTPKP